MLLEIYLDALKEEIGVKDDSLGEILIIIGYSICYYAT